MLRLESDPRFIFYLLTSLLQCVGWVCVSLPRFLVEENHKIIIKWKEKFFSFVCSVAQLGISLHTLLWNPSAIKKECKTTLGTLCRPVVSSKQIMSFPLLAYTNKNYDPVRKHNRGERWIATGREWEIKKNSRTLLFLASFLFFISEYYFLVFTTRCICNYILLEIPLFSLSLPLIITININNLDARDGQELQPDKANTF